jgi:pyrimidine deaminase RibD-like protein
VVTSLPEMTVDEKFMREAIKLARRGTGQTRPNPAVGCVLVKNGRIIARGYHRRAGQPHAEIEALRALKNPNRARGATAYVTLEPCSTHGRTPPCTEALARAGLARVVIGAIDPNPRHRGRGLPSLAKAGIETVAGVLADQCAALNPEFHHFMLTGMPWVVAKCGLSLDGRLTRPPGEGQWITSAAARADAMKLRARVGAILVGAGTIRADDPALTVRGIKSDPRPKPKSSPTMTASRPSSSGIPACALPCAPSVVKASNPFWSRVEDTPWVSFSPPTWPTRWSFILAQWSPGEASWRWPGPSCHPRPASSVPGSSASVVASVSPAWSRPTDSDTIFSFELKNNLALD